MTESDQNADFRRKPQIFADSPPLLEIPASGGRRRPQKTADFRRKPKTSAGNRRKPQIGLCHLRSVTFSSALLSEVALMWKSPDAAHFQGTSWKCALEPPEVEVLSCSRSSPCDAYVRSILKPLVRGVSHKSENSFIKCKFSSLNFVKEFRRFLG